VKKSTQVFSLNFGGRKESLKGGIDGCAARTKVSEGSFNSHRGESRETRPDEGIKALQRKGRCLWEKTALVGSFFRETRAGHQVVGARAFWNKKSAREERTGRDKHVKCHASLIA